LPHQTIIVFFSVYVVHGPDRIKLKKILTKSKFVPKKKKKSTQFFDASRGRTLAIIMTHTVKLSWWILSILPVSSFHPTLTNEQPHRNASDTGSAFCQT